MVRPAPAQGEDESLVHDQALCLATDLEESFARADPRALIQMASGAGKTYTAVSFVYRLIKFAGARRVLFLVVQDSLVGDPGDPGDRFDMILTNPPFGKKSSITVVGENGRAEKERITYERPDFWTTTSNKQLNFLQHVRTLLEVNGRAAIVLPDNVLFEGGAGETVRRKLLQTCDVHTLLRLPTGIFYRPGVKCNVLFFDKKPGREEPWTERLWIYDLRTNVHFTLKTEPMRYEDLSDFIRCYNAENRHERKEAERFRAFGYDELLQRDKVSLDIFWLKDESLEDSENLPEPDVLAAEIVENLESALESFRAITEELEEE